MTEYDIHKLYAEQQERDRITALHANNGVLTVHFGDGTMEVWKKNWRGKLKRKVKRNEFKG
tara:strand:- start:1862 stop:2044 length:183 start_codon:yes stop_codon:yes gene_type:complete